MSVPAGLSPYKQKAVPLTQRSIAAASIGSSYSLVGSIFSDPVVLLIIVSTLDQDVQISWDGSADHLALPSSGTLVIDFKSDDIVFPGNFGVYVKQIGTPTTGTLYISAFTLD